MESVSSFYTSQIDSMIGKRDGQRKGCRYYSSNGLVYDATINIRNRKHSTSFDTPIDGKLNLVDRLQSISQK